MTVGSALSVTPATYAPLADGPHAAPHRDDRRFAWIVLGLFGLYVTLLSALHEPWADETQMWRLAIDSDGIAALVRNARYEGHPLLFHVLLQGVGLLSRSWWAAAAFHALVACGIVWVIVRHSPFGRVEKLLLVTGYYVAYEYAVIVRPYGLATLLALGACAAWTGERRRPLLTVILLVLLANTSVLGLLLALAAAVAFAIGWRWDGAERPPVTTRALAASAACIGVAVLTVWLVAVQVVPPVDAGYKGQGAATQSVSVWEIGWGLTIPLRALTPLAKIGEGTVQWNEWLFDPRSRLALGVAILATIAVVLAGCAIAARRRSALLLWLGGVTGYVAFFELFFAGHARHHGHIVVVWIMAAWLSRRGAATVWPRVLQPLADRAARVARPLFAISLVPMSLAGAEFAVGDALGRFAGSRQAADFLVARSLNDGPILAIARPDAQSVSALLDRPVVHPYQGAAHTWVPWGNTRRGTNEEIAAVTDSLLASACQVAVIGTTEHDLPVPLQPTMPVVYETPARTMIRTRLRIRLKSAPPSARCPAPRPA